jgi:mRNA interferase HigB
VRLHNRATARDFAVAHAEVRRLIASWCTEVERASWAGPTDIKRAHPTASILPNDRVVFNLMGNSYRIVVHIKYEFHVVYIRFIGTHREYDDIDATTI